MTSLYDGPPVENNDVLDIYIILNGSLNMTPGKIAAQTFHCGWLSSQSYYPAWQEQGRRVSVRIAKTQHIFDRAVEELEGVAQYDEGLTEVERGAMTAYVTKPYRRADAPKILSNSKCGLYKG